MAVLDEPEGLERLWRALSAGDDQSHKLWTDDYLAAFAQTADLTLVTLDRSFIKRYPSVRVEVIQWPVPPPVPFDDTPAASLPLVALSVVGGGGRCAPTRP